MQFFELFSMFVLFLFVCFFFLFYDTIKAVWRIKLATSLSFIWLTDGAINWHVPETRIGSAVSSQAPIIARIVPFICDDVPTPPSTTSVIGSTPPPPPPPTNYTPPPPPPPIPNDTVIELVQMKMETASALIGEAMELLLCWDINIRRPCSDFMDMLRRLINYRIIINGSCAWNRLRDETLSVFVLMISCYINVRLIIIIIIIIIIKECVMTIYTYIHTYIHKFITHNIVKQSSNQRRRQSLGGDG